MPKHDKHKNNTECSKNENIDVNTLKAHKIDTDKLFACAADIDVIAANTITAADATFFNANISNAKIENENVTNSNIFNANITNETVVNQTVTNQSITNQNVTNQTVANLTITNRLILPDPVTINVPSANFPTIQSAINFFNGRHAMNGTIIIAPGRYVETLTINKWVAAVSNNTRNEPYDGFSIIGDNRKFSGTTYLNGGFNVNPGGLIPGGGVNFGAINLVDGPNTIQVTGPGAVGLNFTTMGVVIGNTLKIRDNSGTWNERSVTAVGTATLTYSGTDLTVGGTGSAFTLCPNVEIVGATSDKPTIYVSFASVILEGLWFNSDPAHGAAPLLAGNALFQGPPVDAVVVNCLFDNSANNFVTTAQGKNVGVFGGSFRAHRYVGNPIGANISSNTIIRGGIDTNAMPFSVTDGTATIGAMSVFDNPTTIGVFGEDNAIVNGALLQAVNCNQGAQVTNMSLGTFARFYILQCPIGFLAAINSAFSFGQANFISKIDCSGIANSVGISVGRGSWGRHNAGTISISNAVSAVPTLSSSIFYIEAAAAFTFTNTLDATIMTENLATYNGMRAAATPGNVFTYTTTTGASFVGTIVGTVLTVTSIVSGSIQTGQRINGTGVPGSFILSQVLPLIANEELGGRGRYNLSVTFVGPLPGTTTVALENAYQNQVINTALPTFLSLNPAATASGAPRYLGKTFTIRSNTTAPHELQLSGAFFRRFAVPNATTAVFSNVSPNSFITFTVESVTTVVVTDFEGINFF